MTPRNEGFFSEAITLRGSVTPRVMFEVLSFGLIAVLTCVLSLVLEKRFGVSLKLQVGWFEVAGAAISLLLVLRTNGGYDRWWEARKLWGAIVNQCRNLVISGLAYGPDDARWRDRFVRMTAAFPLVSRASLRSEPASPKLAALIGKEAADKIERAEHRPSAICAELAFMLQEAVHEYGMEPLAFAQVDRERAELIDHIGGCERIKKTPLPRVYSIKTRRLIALFLVTLPLVLLARLKSIYLIPLVTISVAYPLIALDYLGQDLQNPFDPQGLAALPLEDIELTIERNVTALLESYQMQDWERLRPHSLPEPPALVLTRSGRIK